MLERSFKALEGLASGFTFGAEDFLAPLLSACSDEELWAVVGARAALETMGDGGRRPVRRFAILLIMVP